MTESNQSNREIRRVDSVTRFKDKSYRPEKRTLPLLNFENRNIVKMEKSLMNMIAGFKCVICLNIPWDPVECFNCSAIFCTTCYEEYIKHSIKCPVDKKNLNVKKSYNAIKALEIINIKCYNPGCNQISSYSNYMTHLKNVNSDNIYASMVIVISKVL